MTTKKVEIVYSPSEPHYVGDGFRVHNFIPSKHRLDMKRMDPFILLDYNSKFNFSPSDTPRGVGVHPHRGFETVTIAYKGAVSHHDSQGGSGTVYEGDVQWMTAASGILHKEYHEKEYSKKGGDFQMVQLWVNLPKEYKMSQPKYQPIKNEQIQRYIIENNGGEVEVIAGELYNVKGAATTFTPMNIYNVKLNKGAQFSMNFPAHFNTGLLVIEGSITINGSDEAPTDFFALMENEGEQFTIEATENAVVLVLSGEPIGEPIAAHGPFVMNTRTELMQAFEDFNAGKFGTLHD